MTFRTMLAALSVGLCLPCAALGQGAPTPSVAPPALAAPDLGAGGATAPGPAAAPVAPAPGAGVAAPPVAAPDADVVAPPVAAQDDDVIAPPSAAPAAAEDVIAAPAPAPAADQGAAPAAPAPQGIFAGIDAALEQYAGAEGGHGLSPIGMFLAADIIVKGVMILLLLLSALAWAVWLMRLGALAIGRRALRRGYHALENAGSLPQAIPAARKGNAPVARMIRAAAAELERSSAPGFPVAGVKERASSHLARIEAASARRMQTGAGLLASIGSTAPFIGLFGTVWGIMNSFIGIADSGTTNLAVVAPGIAEALLATAMGLVAAIPATLFYNQLARANGGYRAMLADATALVERTLSRDLDRPAAQAASLFAAE